MGRWVDVSLPINSEVLQHVSYRFYYRQHEFSHVIFLPCVNFLPVCIFRIIFVNNFAFGPQVDHEVSIYLDLFSESTVTELQTFIDLYSGLFCIR